MLLAPLLYFKYFDFLFAGLRLGSLHAQDLALPLGISFYTFSALGYVIDCHRGRVEPYKDFTLLLSGISFFPCLISGPIERQNELIPQLRAERSFDYDTAAEGLKIMAWGYFKKLVIAGTLSITTDEVFSNLHAYTGWPLILAAFAFSVQIYCDFSGYSDIAVGSARLFGIRLNRNFDAPYLATSIRDFWGRWHISLSHWFRDYVYIPLGGNRRGRLRKYINLMITFLVSGLWHGAGWSFIIWGGLHGLAQVLEDCMPKALMKIPENGFLLWLRRLWIFVLVTSAWVFFKAESAADAFYIFGNMFKPLPVSPGEMDLPWLLDLMNVSSVSDIFTIILSLIMLAVFDVCSIGGDVWQRVGRWKKPARWALYLGLGFLTLLLKPEESVGQFIYFKF